QPPRMALGRGVWLRHDGLQGGLNGVSFCGSAHGRQAQEPPKGGLVKRGVKWARMAPRPTDDEAARQLSRLGYAQELLRAMGGFSSFALSFSIISILTGVTTTYGVALGGGGPAALGLGWPLVSLGTLVVGVAMAELASAFPVAGALYHWSALLGGAGW